MQAADQPFPKLLGTDLCKAISRSQARGGRSPRGAAFLCAYRDREARQQGGAVPSQQSRAVFATEALAVQS